MGPSPFANRRGFSIDGLTVGIMFFWLISHNKLFLVVMINIIRIFSNFINSGYDIVILTSFTYYLGILNYCLPYYHYVQPIIYLVFFF